MLKERHRIRRSLIKTQPAPADLDPSELAYTAINGRLWTKNPITGAVECVGGKEFVDTVQQLSQVVGGVNQLPVVQAVTRTIFDDSNTVTGNLLTGSSDPEGTTLFVSAVSYAGTVRQTGTAFSLSLIHI